MYRAFLLLSELRHVYRLPAEEAVDRLEQWLAWASRSKLKPFVKLARTIRHQKAGVLAAIEFGINNGRLESLNSKIRLISHRAYGFHSAGALIAMVYLCSAASRSTSLTNEFTPKRAKEPISSEVERPKSTLHYGLGRQADVSRERSV
jgi:hypothetical protein